MPAAAPDDASPAANPALIAHVRGMDDAAHARALGLERFALDVRVRGSVAETTITATFANPLSEVLEGDFRYQLPAGAIVTGYALDIGGKLVDGVLVDRPRARAVYADRVRAGVDPGLAEVRRDGLFETHIFPIPPGGGRTIRLRFVLPVGAEGLALPLALEAPTRGWAITVNASGTRRAPAITLPDGGKLTPAAMADGFTAAAQGTSPINGTLTIAAPAAADMVVSRHARGERDVELGGTLPAGAAARPATARIYWDRARARKDSRHDAEIALVARWIDTVAPGAGRTGHLQQQRRTAPQCYQRGRGHRLAWCGQLSWRHQPGRHRP